MAEVEPILPRPALGGIIGVLAVLAAGETCAQPMYDLGSWEAELELGLEWRKRDTNVDETPSSNFQKTRYDEQLAIRNSRSFILDPRLITNSLAARFGLVQEEAPSDNRESFLTGTLLDYSLDSVILSDTPYTVRLFTNRTQSIFDREFGGRSEVTFENRGGAFSLRENSFLGDLGIPYFTSVLRVRQEVTQEDTTVLDQTFRRDEVRTVLGYEANKGFETSDLNLRYEFTNLDDRQDPRGDFQTQIASLSYDLDFGPTLNRRWTSRLQYSAHTGRSPSMRLSADGELRLDHYENLFTEYRYRFSRSEANARATTTHIGTILLQHEFYKNLTTRLETDGRVQDIVSGERTSYGTEAELSYRRSLPWQGGVFGRAGARYQVNDNRFETSHLDVIDEPHTAPGQFGGSAGFVLANPFVVTSTIVVVDRRGGGSLPTTLGVDYVLVQEGDFTRIVPLAGSPVILAGDPLVVSYAFDVDPNQKFSTVFWHGHAGVDFRWIAFTLSREQSEQTLLSGRDGQFLDDRIMDTARLELRGDWERVRGLVTTQYQIEDSTHIGFSAWQFGQSLSFRPLSDVVLHLNAQESFTDFTLPQRVSERYSGRADLTWTPLPSLFVNGFTRFHVFEDTELPTETLREVGLRVHWRFGKLEVTPTFTWTVRERGTVETADFRGDLRVIRHF